MSYDPSGSESSVHNELYGLTYKRMYIILMNKPMYVELTSDYVYKIQYCNVMCMGISDYDEASRDFFGAPVETPSHRSRLKPF